MLDHMEEPINRRSLWLRLGKKLWWIPACMVVGVLASVLVYTGIWLRLAGQRQYRQASKYYLTFGQDEAGNPQDYYNDYTWNDLIFSVPAISQVIESELPDGITMEDARRDIEAQILSDVRVLTIQVTDSDPQIVQALTDAVQDALVRYGHTAEEFRRIEYLSSGEVEQVVVADRTRNAALLGALLGLLISAAVLWSRELLNDGVYCPEDAAKRYDLPVLLVLPGNLERTSEKHEGKREKDAELPAFLLDENVREAEKLVKEHPEGVRLISEDPELAGKASEQLQKTYGIGVCEENGITLAVIPFGRENGTGTDHLLTQKRLKGEAPAGLILAEADGTFLKKYYGRK